MQGWLRLVRVWLGEGGTGTECAHRWPGADRRGPSSSRGRSVAVRGVSAVQAGPVGGHQREKGPALGDTVFGPVFDLWQ